MSAALASWLPWVQAVGWTLLHFIWQGLVVGAGFGIARALLPKTHCNARYLAGLVALALLVAWPVATLVALRPAQTGAGVATTLAQPDGAVATLAPGASNMALAPIDHLLPLLVLLWLLGVLVVAARALRQWRALARVAREWAQSHNELDALLAGLTRRFGFVRRIRVLVSARVDTPMLIGWIKPVILLPTAVALGFPRQQVELILAHELGHLRRYDHLVNLGQALLETLLFYHPVVHWISREVRNERELCCDELVLRLTRGEPREYARTLAALEELRQPLQLAVAASGGVLVERVRRIVGMPAPRLGERPNPARWLLLGALVALAVSMALRVDREGDVRYVGGLTIDWLAQPEIRVLPIAALALPFKQAPLRLEVAAPTLASVQPRAATPAPQLARRAMAQDFASVAPPATPAAASPSPEIVQARLAEPTPAVAMPSLPTRMPATAAPAPSPAVAVPSTPVATRVVMPRFPSYARSASGRVDTSFRIDADGVVQDIRIANEEAGSVFARAAERALRQWRFDRATLPADRAARYQQSFVFAPPTAQDGVRRAESTPCVQSTGTHICRAPDEGGSVASVTTITPRR